MTVLHRESKAGTGTGKATPEYRAWDAMKVRCFNRNNKDYVNYGGRGIGVCEEWRLDYRAFLAHVGRRPSPRHSIDRINNDGNYEPGNVRWATVPEQNRNRAIHNRKQHTHCKRGHVMTAGNIGARSDGFKTCLACRRLTYAEKTGGVS